MNLSLYNESTELQISTSWYVIPISILFVQLDILIFCGNFLVILAVISTRRLQTVTNLYVVSLALADLLVAIFVLPLSTAFHLFDYHWPTLPTAICKAWLSLDILLCTASILNLCAISMDRYFAITRPLRYAMRRSKSNARLVIILVWILSSLVTIPALLGVTSHDTEGGRCAISKDVIYRIFTSLCSFFLPFFVIHFVYARIFWVARQRIHDITIKLPHCSKNVEPSISICTMDNGNVANAICGNEKQMDKLKNPSNSNFLKKPLDKPSLSTNSFTASNDQLHTKRYIPIPSVSMTDVSRGVGRPSQTLDYKLFKKVKEEVSESEREFILPLTFPRSSQMVLFSQNIMCPRRPDPLQKLFWQHQIARNMARASSLCLLQTWKRSTSSDDFRSISSMNVATLVDKTPDANGRMGMKFRKERAAFQREHKTAKTLAFVVGCFSLCWLPFFCCYILEVFFPIPDIVLVIATWLGYVNSIFNPFIYAFYNKEYAAAFKRLLCQHHFAHGNINRR